MNLTNFQCERADSIAAIVGRHKRAAREGAETAVEAGRMLAAAKGDCQHGAWLPFLVRAGIPERTARNWMTLAKAVDEGHFEIGHVADMGVRECLYWYSKRDMLHRIFAAGELLQAFMVQSPETMGQWMEDNMIRDGAMTPQAQDMFDLLVFKLKPTTGDRLSLCIADLERKASQRYMAGLRKH